MAKKTQDENTTTTGSYVPNMGRVRGDIIGEIVQSTGVTREQVVDMIKALCKSLLRNQGYCCGSHPPKPDEQT